MAKFLTRRVLSLLFTMLIVSMMIFGIAEVAPGDVVRHLLGQFATPEQEDSLREQLGLTRPLWQRYVTWLIGSDMFGAQPKVGMPLAQTASRQTGYTQWWAEEEDGTLVQWQLEGEDLIASRLQEDGSVVESVDNGRWNIDATAEAGRLVEYREQVLANSQISAEDRQAIVQEIDRLVEILNQDGLSNEERLAALGGPEGALNGLKDSEAADQRNGLRTAASAMAQTDVVQALNIARQLTESSETPDDETMRTMPNRLGKAATALAETRPELAESLRAASKSLLGGDMEGARAHLAEVVGPLDELTLPVTSLSGTIAEADYSQAASLLASMLDPSSPPDEAQTALLAAQFKVAARALSSAIPEVAESFTQASENLKEGDVAAAREELVGIAALVRERGPVIARNDAIKRAKVGRSFWGVDNENHAVLWETGGDQTFWLRAKSAGWWTEQEGGASKYIPLQKGFLRGDPGESVRTRQPVNTELMRRLRNSAILAAAAFVIVMPLALFMGLIAGLNEGKKIDRVFSIFGLVTTASPSFATGIFLILIFAVWLRVLPGATVFTSSSAIFDNPKMLILPILTLTLIELGYVLRITRASMVEVMKTPYIRTAFLKGLPYRRIVAKHALRNALLAPITVIMLHINWLIGGIVVVEAIFGFPGLGNYLLTSALYKDVFAIEAGAMVMVVIAVSTQLIADIIYTFLNPRIRYA